VVRWFVDRMLVLIDSAAASPGGFYDRFVSWSPDERRAFAHDVWDAINGPNLRDHIAPTRAGADWVVEFGADHRPTTVRPS
jgi:type I pantothenate kinase